MKNLTEEIEQSQKCGLPDPDPPMDNKVGLPNIDLDSKTRRLSQETPMDPPESAKDPEDYPMLPPEPESIILLKTMVCIDL